MTTRHRPAQAGERVQLAAAPQCVLFRGERRLWCEMPEAERQAYVDECRRLRAELEARA